MATKIKNTNGRGAAKAARRTSNRSTSATDKWYMAGRLVDEHRTPEAFGDDELVAYVFDCLRKRLATAKGNLDSFKRKLRIEGWTVKGKRLIKPTPAQAAPERKALRANYAAMMLK